MKTLYIIGNGFDIAHNLETGYDKFREYLYKNKFSHAWDFVELIEKATQNISLWSEFKTALITARNAPADRRVITTLEKLGIKMDKAFFMGGVDKSRVINIMRPQIFFDDDKRNLENLSNVVAVHVPFGVVYEEQVEQNSEETKAYSTRKKRAQRTPKAPTITQKDIDELNRRN